jgi:hypothetical protein
MLLAVVIRNEWDTLVVILALIVLGLGQGALVTVLFNVLAAGARRRSCPVMSPRCEAQPTTTQEAWAQPIPARS